MEEVRNAACTLLEAARGKLAGTFPSENSAPAVPENSRAAPSKPESARSAYKATFFFDWMALAGPRNSRNCNFFDSSALVALEESFQLLDRSRRQPPYVLQVAFEVRTTRRRELLRAMDAYIAALRSSAGAHCFRRRRH